MFKDVRPGLKSWAAKYRLPACAGAGLFLALAPACRADNYALIIGIDQYKQSQRINTLEGAGNDAKNLAQTLQQVAGFPAGNIRLLVSGAEPEPTGANITDALDQISHRIKPGDTLYLLYSGHGIDIDGKSYLVPWDADARTAASLLRTVLPTAELRDQLSHVPAKTLLMAFDMCRTDPRKGARDLGSNNLLGPNQARDLQIVPAKNNGGGPQDVITLFACSEGERSWEWEEKQRGFFSYYLEQGLRHDAADNHGVVRAGNLVPYLQKAVYGAVERQEGEAQTPYPVLEPKDATNVVLATGLAAGNGGFSGVDPASLSRADAALQRGYELYQQKIYPGAQIQFQTALNLQPNSAKAADGLGRTYLAMNNNAQAETLFRQAVQSDANTSAFQSDLGDVLAARSDGPEAETAYRAAIRLDPNNEAPLLSLANLSHKVTHNDDLAQRALRRALKVNPKDPRPWDRMGDIAFDGGDYPTAEKDYRHAVSMDTFGGQYLGHLAKCYLKEGRKQDAQAVIDNANRVGIKIPSNILNTLDLKSRLRNMLHF